MKNYLIIIVLFILLLFSGCEMLYPEQNTPTPQPVITYTPVPATMEPVTTAVTDNIDAEPTPTEELYDLSELYSLTISTSEYMAGDYYKAGAGFRDAVNVEYITSSSYLAEQAGNNYGPDNLYDFDLDTVWCEGRSDYGVGEWALYRVKAEDYAPNASISKIEIINGYIKSDDLFNANSMAKRILVTIDDIELCILNLKVSKDIQVFTIPTINLSTTDAIAIKFEILEVYEGEVYKDTCITAIEFDGSGIY